jgi:hypothetical protein
MNPRPASQRLDQRFLFGDVIHSADQSSLSVSLVEAEERSTGDRFTLRLWEKSGTPADADLRQLWRHEMRQIERVMAYPGARDVIVDILEFVEDDARFGVVFQPAGLPLAHQIEAASRTHWLKNLARSRVLLWQNLRRIAVAIGIVHAQGLIHGNVNADSVMTESSGEPDFRLSGFEWSLRLGVEQPTLALSQDGRESTYSFEGDWKALAHLAARSLSVKLKPSGQVVTTARTPENLVLIDAELALLRRLAAPAATDAADAASVAAAINDLLAMLARSSIARGSMLILTPLRWDSVAKLVYDVTDGQIAKDDRRGQIDWVSADLDTGVTLLTPREFKPEHSKMRLVTRSSVYELRPYRETQGSLPSWEIAVCDRVGQRADELRVGGDDEHTLSQTITVAASFSQARELRATNSADVLDWGAFGSSRSAPVATPSVGVKRALLLLQAIEALVCSLESIPVEVRLSGSSPEGRKTISVRALHRSERDALAVLGRRYPSTDF